MPAGKSKENKGIHRGSVRQESKIPYDKIYENKFGRKVSLNLSTDLFESCAGLSLKCLNPSVTKLINPSVLTLL